MLRAIALTSLLFTAANAAAADLRVQIIGITAHSGTISAALMDSDAAWTGKGKPVSAGRAKVEVSNELELLFTDCAALGMAGRAERDQSSIAVHQHSEVRPGAGGRQVHRAGNRLAYSRCRAYPQQR